MCHILQVKIQFQIENENIFSFYFTIIVPIVSQLTVLSLKGCFMQICTECILGTLRIGGGRFTWHPGRWQAE